jgi:DMSO/TMAO reductase YedYZ heme-binding membrane subunit
MSVIIYSVVFIAYTVARSMAALKNRRAQNRMAAADR